MLGSSKSTLYNKLLDVLVLLTCSSISLSGGVASGTHI